jgi:hypothetical protein
MTECMSSMIGSFPSGVGCRLCSCENIRGIDYMWGNSDDDMTKRKVARSPHSLLAPHTMFEPMTATSELESGA